MRKVTRLEINKKYWVNTQEAMPPTNENGSTYPWGDVRDRIPIKCLAEYDFFYVCEVLPHLNRVHAFGFSGAYKVTIEKFQLSNGVFKAWEEE